MHAGHRRAARWSRTHPDIGRAFVQSPSWHVVWGIEPPPPAHRTSMLHGGATVELVAGQAELGHVSKRRSAMVSASRTRARNRPAPVLCARGSRPIAPMGLARTPANGNGWRARCSLPAGTGAAIARGRAAGDISKPGAGRPARRAPHSHAVSWPVCGARYAELHPGFKQVRR